MGHHMIAGWSGSPRVVNGLFGVFKDFGPTRAIRLIIDARRFNRRIVESPYVPLVTPAGLGACLPQRPELVSACEKGKRWEKALRLLQEMLHRSLIIGRTSMCTPLFAQHDG